MTSAGHVGQGSAAKEVWRIRKQCCCGTLRRTLRCCCVTVDGDRTLKDEGGCRQLFLQDAGDPFELKVHMGPECVDEDTRKVLTQSGQHPHPIPEGPSFKGTGTSSCSLFRSLNPRAVHHWPPPLDLPLILSAGVWNFVTNRGAWVEKQGRPRSCPSSALEQLAGEQRMTRGGAIQVGLICFRPQKVICDNPVPRPTRFDLSWKESKGRFEGWRGESTIVPQCIV